MPCETRICGKKTNFQQHLKGQYQEKIELGVYLGYCSARDWDGKDYLRIIPRVVLVEDPRLT